MKQRIVIFQAEGGNDKGFDGHRKDTIPILNAIKQKGWDCQVVFFRDQWADAIFTYVKNKFDAYISRINPGTLANGQVIFFQTLKKLSEAGLVGMSHPDIMIKFGSKDALFKLAGTPIVPADTYSYYDIETFKSKFPVTLSLGQRVLKQNRGSTGSGIWRVQVVDSTNVKKGQALDLSTKIKCTQAVDNHVQFHELGEFMTFCERYIVGQNGMLVDMAFLPRIKQGQIRILLVGQTPIFVVHKKPAQSQDAFSATLFSGAKYTYDSPDKWSQLIKVFKQSLPMISQRLECSDIPLIWTADFMLDWDQNKNDKYILGQINCSCVGFTSHLNMGIQDVVADQAKKRVIAKFQRQ